MYAIVDILGQQLKVEKNRKLYINRLKAEIGEKITFDTVYLLEDDARVEIGVPVVENAKVEATVLSHLKGNKVIIFKKKRRKGYQIQNGFRPYLTQIVINDIITK